MVEIVKLNIKQSQQFGHKKLFKFKTKLEAHPCRKSIDGKKFKSV